MDAHTDPSLPFAPPPGLTPRRVALAATALGAAVAAGPSIAWLEPFRTHGLPGGSMSDLVVAISTAALTLVLIGRATRASAWTRALASCAAGGAVLGAVNAGVCLGTLLMIDKGSALAGLGGLVMGTFFGGIIGAPLGLAYGVTMAVVVHAAVSAELHPSHDAVDRTAAVAGAWLFCVGLAAAGASRSDLHALAAALASGVGAATLSAAALALLGRARFLRRVAGGHDPRWVLVPRELAGACDALLPFRRRAGYDGVLARRAAAGQAPYREVALASPAALVAMPPAVARRAP